MQRRALVACLWFACARALVRPAARRRFAPRRLSPDEGAGAAPLAVAFGFVLAGAGKLQWDAYQGDRGLGAFLRDGDGFNKSAYKPLEAPEGRRPPPRTPRPRPRPSGSARARRPPPGLRKGGGGVDPRA